MLQYLKTSTLKREAASILMLWLLAMATRTFWNADPATQLAVLGMFSPFVFAVFGGAYTFDWISKQTNIAGPPSNTETTVKTEMTDNSATTSTKSEEIK